MGSLIMRKGQSADGRFVAGFTHALEHTGANAPEDASRAAGKLLPDILSYDPSRPACFPSNGRTLTDHAGDAFLAVLTNGRIVEDKVEAHRDLLAEFPYLGPPHSARRLVDAPTSPSRASTSPSTVGAISFNPRDIPQPDSIVSVSSR
jgi:hypothetical protein